MAIQKISKEDIDFSKIYSTKYDADNEQNNVKVNEIYWGDNGDLFFDDETGMISENGVTLGFTNKDSIKSIEEVAPKTSRYNGSYSDDNDIMKQGVSTQTSGNVNGTLYAEDADIAGSDAAPIEGIDTVEEAANEVEEEVKIDESATTNESNGEIATVDEVDMEEIVPESEESSSDNQEETPIEEIETTTDTENEENSEVIESEEDNLEPETDGSEEKINSIENSNSSAKEINDEVFASLNGKDYSAKSNNGTGRCGAQAHDVLVNMGVLNSDYKSNGITFAGGISDDNLTAGHSAVSHSVNSSNQNQVFDQIVSSNGGSTGPVVISFNSEGHYRNSGPYGHVVVVTGIDNGNVYVIDSSNKNWTSGTTREVYNIDEFKEHYFGDGTEANSMTEIK